MKIDWRSVAAAGLFAGSAALGTYAIIGVRPSPLPSPAPVTSSGGPTLPSDPTAPAVPEPAWAPAPRVGLLAPARPYHVPPLPEHPITSLPENAENLYADVSQALACITRITGEEEVRTTGFLIDARGHVLTAAGGLSAASSVWVTLPEAGTQLATVVFEDDTSPLALLRLSAGVGSAPLPLARTRAPEHGAALAVVLCTSGRGSVLQKTVVLAQGSAPDELLLDGAFPRESAGAPIVGSHGAAVGILLPVDPARPEQGRAYAMHAALARLAALSPTQPAFGLTAADYVRFGAEQMDLHTAVTAFRTALLVEPGLPLATYNLGVATAQLPGGAATAAAAYRQTTRFAPRFVDAYVNGALLALERDAPAEAAALLESATLLRAEDAAAWSTLGEVYRRLDRTVNAAAALKRATALAPTYAPAHYNLGVLRAAMSPDSGDARAAFARYAEFAPASPEAPAARAFATQPDMAATE